MEHLFDNRGKSTLLCEVSGVFQFESQSLKIDNVPLKCFKIFQFKSSITNFRQIRLKYMKLHNYPQDFFKKNFRPFRRKILKECLD
jgi:hypothetical protein